MASKKLIYASDARRAILKAEPRLAYCIDNIPTVDAVEVVRCKDCKYFKRIKTGYGECPFFDEIKDEEFCSSGERRDGE